VPLRLVGSEMCIRDSFDKEVIKSENTQAEISPTKKAVKLEVSAYSVAVKPALLTNEISVSAD
jgi:hypothetical protein